MLDIDKAEEHLITLRFIDEDIKELLPEMSYEQLQLFFTLTKIFSDLCWQEIKRRKQVKAGQDNWSRQLRKG